MAYALHDLIGGQPIADASSVQKHVLGTRIRAWDPVYGEGEFIYLKGVASTVVGSAVTYESKTGVTTLTVAASRGPIAVAMSACVAGQFGWYAIAGNVPVKVLAGIVAGNRAVVTATAGSLDDTAAANVMVLGAAFSSADAGGLADIQLDHPCAGDSNL